MPDMETNEKLLKNFFSENKKEIADNGFTNRVMRNLPEVADRGWIVWVFTAIGLSLTMALVIYTGLFQGVFGLMKHVSIYYILAGIFSFPLLGTAGMYLYQNKSYKLI
jgi:hypothetical protein